MQLDCKSFGFNSLLDTGKISSVHLEEGGLGRLTFWGHVVNITRMIVGLDQIIPFTEPRVIVQFLEGGNSAIHCFSFCRGKEYQDDLAEAKRFMTTIRNAKEQENG